MGHSRVGLSRCGEHVGRVGAFLCVAENVYRRVRKPLRLDWNRFRRSPCHYARRLYLADDLLGGHAILQYIRPSDKKRPDIATDLEKRVTDWKTRAAWEYGLIQHFHNWLRAMKVKVSPKDVRGMMRTLVDTEFTRTSIITPSGFLLRDESEIVIRSYRAPHEEEEKKEEEIGE